MIFLHSQIAGMGGEGVNEANAAQCHTYLPQRATGSGRLLLKLRMLWPILANGGKHQAIPVEFRILQAVDCMYSKPLTVLLVSQPKGRVFRIP
jgi:hypothetical protein